MTRHTSIRTALVAAAFVFTLGSANAATNLVVNGGFETLSNGDGEIVPGQTGTRISSATSWYSYSTSSNAGYPFLFFATNAVTTGFADAWDNGQRYLWGGSNGGANTWDGTSAQGGHYLVMDGDYHATAISQNIAGLVSGQTYALSFSWAAAQWYGITGATTESIQVSLGNQVKSTSICSLADKGFSGWMTSVMNFTYDGTSPILSFLAVGGPSGLPPIALLDGVSLSAVAEPTSLATLLIGLGILGGSGAYSLRRRRLHAV